MSGRYVRGTLGAWGLGTGLVLVVGLGCSNLSEQECSDLRGKAFEIVNEAHPCNSDEDCVGTEWPGCMKPVSAKNNARIVPLMEQFKKGKCTEPERDCRNPPEVYCKQGLCVVRERPPEG